MEANRVFQLFRHDQRDTLDALDQLLAIRRNLVLELLRNGRTVVEKLAVDQTSNESRAADAKQNVLGIRENLDNIVIIVQNSFDLAQGRARHNKLHIAGNALDGLTAYRQAVAVNGHDVQAAAFDFKQAAGVDGLGFVIRNRENGLRDHALEDGLRQREPLVAGHISQSRIFVSLAGHQVEH